MPENLSGVRGKQTDNRFQQRGLSCAIWSDDAEHFARRGGEGHVIDGAFFAIPFRQINDTQRRNSRLVDGQIRGENRFVSGHAASLTKTGRDSWACRLVGRSLSPWRGKLPKPTLLSIGNQGNDAQKLPETFTSV